MDISHLKQKAAVISDKIVVTPYARDSCPYPLVAKTKKALVLSIWWLMPWFLSVLTDFWGGCLHKLCL